MARDPLKRLAYKRKWDAENKHRQAGYRNRYRDKYPEKTLVKKARDRCRKSGMEITITHEDILIPNVCPILLIPIIWKGGWNAPSLDRVDNSKGYTKENTRVISWSANRWKRNLTIEDVKRLLLYMENK